ncbi:hypothetical protein [Flavobacterium aquatile]|uniref:Uncharacterized protein n=1 Tax=Flavobacterium aquatile LMG 4008 = ATCC 11947 TaxID=1453498 RepID=A0A095U0U8_9FLAO|nr:hypothetical protein [Flavobacterium aquatile]KGD68248.1 hypothetical protein LG45_08120 [Flavobacterium aquatile LMG 4008 = ATCC 11947]OXA68817.1 hypothetical protein B0A61_03680 [Flavobacterium aquatile LMG 4008 = ATCC 11947]GEC77277.1 hypothetical protein FAQ01_01470 [Flavobacterium aquatile]
MKKIILAICLFFANIILAQAPKLTTPKTSTIAKNSKLTSTFTKKEITTSRASGTSNEYLVTASDIKISSAPALSDFRLWYNNGDHKVRTIGILHDQGSMNAKYSDQNGDDPFRVEAKWLNIPDATGGTITAAGSGTFNIQLPAKPANTTLVISGFSFERLAGTDNNIRTMSIKMDQDNALAQVSFIDDQREDYRSVVDPVATGILAIAPFGTIIETGLTIDGILKGMSNDKSTARPYVATIQYAYIPNSRIIANGSVSGTSRSKSAMQGQIPNWYQLAYRGFTLRFNNSDHHLLGMGIHLNGINTFPGQRGTHDAPITWQDNNMDDRIQWLVDYSSIK